MSEKKYLRRENVAVSDAPDGEKMMLDIEQGKYFGLNKIGALIWNELAEPKTVDELVGLFAGRASVERVVIETDVCEFIEEMLKKNLIMRIEAG